MVSNQSLINNETLDVYLDCFIRIRDIERINQVFEVFLERKKEPNRPLVKFLCDVPNLPDEVYNNLRRLPFGEKILKGRQRTYFRVDEYTRKTTPKEKERNRITKN